MTASVLQDSPQAIAAGSSLTVVSTAPASNCAVGSIIECWVTTDTNSVPSTVQDSAGQSYSLQASFWDATNTTFLALYTFLNNQSATALTITVTWGAGKTSRGAWMREIGGCNAIQASTAAPSIRNAAGTTATDGVAGNAYTPTAQPCLISSLAMLTGSIASGTPASGTGFAAGATGWVLPTNPQAISESIRLTALSAKTPTFTSAANGSSTWSIGAIVYTEGAFAGGGSFPPVPQSPWTHLQLSALMVR